MDEPKVVVSTPRRRRFGKKPALVVLVIAVLLVGGGAWYWMHNRQKSGTTAGVPQLSGQELTDAVNKKYEQKDYTGAAELLKAQKASADPANQLMLANTYAMQKNYTGALGVYAELDRAGKLTANSAASAGSIAEQAGDNKTAIHYYQVALQKAKENQNPDNDDIVPMYQAKIEELQQK